MVIITAIMGGIRGTKGMQMHSLRWFGPRRIKMELSPFPENT